MNNTRQVSCPFGLLNIGGLIQTKPIIGTDDIIGSEVVIPLFCHETYKIKPTFNTKLDKSFAMISIKDDANDGKYYQKKFRRNVLWDFGDGYTEEGYSVEHYYSKPGRYKITCTFYDINRCAWKNSYHIYVSVKEIIPTQLSFVKNLTKSEIKCSKIERITRLEAMLSLTCKEDLQVQAKRIFTEDEEEANYEEVKRNFKEVPSEIFKFMRKYWTFLENKQQLLYHSDKIFGSNLTPNDLYTPDYISLYGRFIYNENNVNEPIDIEIYQVIPYSKVDDNLKTIRVLNPNCKLDDLIAHDGSEEDYLEKFTKVVNIQQVYLDSQLPSDVIFLGKRAFVDVFYKNDYLTTEGHDNTFSFYYDIEHKNITRELNSSDNYLNINPIGLSLRVIKNDIQKVKVGVSLDGFIREIDDVRFSDDDYYIDPYLINGLVKDIDLDLYFFPYIEYTSSQEVIEGFEDIEISNDEETDFVTLNNMYYVPKDCDITLGSPEQLVDKEFGVGSVLNIDRITASDDIEQWLKRLPFTLFDYFAYRFNVGISGKIVSFDIVKKPLIKPDDLKIPTEKMVKEDVNEIVNTYMIHPMFEDTPNIKEFFKIFLNGKNLLNYTLTKSNNFLDDYANVKTCYLSQLISTLKMMGEDILEYEKGGFEGINDMRDFVRLLTMNHSDLIGHVISDKLDTTVRLDRKGKNVSDQIKINDTLVLQTNDVNYTKGKILKFTRGENSWDCTQIAEGGVDLIVQDKYTFETKIVNFRLIDKTEVEIRDYEPSWGWNLLLPKRYEDCLTKLKENDEYKLKHGYDLYSKNELQKIKEIRGQIIDGYYSFYLLNPNTNTKRVGNFLEENTITDRINDPEDWSSKWGISHEILMKIFRDNGQYKHTKYVIEDDVQTYGLRRILDDDSIYGEIDTEITAINSNVYFDTVLSYECGVDGIINVYGVVCEGTEQWLELKLNNCYVYEEDYSETLRGEEDQMLFKIKIDNEGTIQPTKQVYKVFADTFEGTLSIALSGKLRKEKGQIKGFMWDASFDLFSK